MTKTFTNPEVQLIVALLTNLGSGISGVNLTALGTELGISNKSTVSSRVSRLKDKLGMKGGLDSVTAKDLGATEIELMCILLRHLGISHTDLAKLGAALGVSNKSTMSSRISRLKVKLGLQGKVAGPSNVATARPKTPTKAKDKKRAAAVKKDPEDSESEMDVDIKNGGNDEESESEEAEDSEDIEESGEEVTEPTTPRSFQERTGETIVEEGGDDEADDEDISDYYNAV